MSADDVKSAVERLTKIADAFANAYPQYSGGVYREVASLLSQLTEENEQLREAIGLSSADIFDDLMDLYADPHINRLTYAAAKAIVIAEERATKAEAERGGLVRSMATTTSMSSGPEGERGARVVIVMSEETDLYERLSHAWDIARSAQGGEHG